MSSTVDNMTEKVKVLLPNTFRPVAMANPVRIGSENDGGYVVPGDLIQRCKKLISFGINLDWTFEDDFLRRFPESVVETYDYTTRFSYVLRWCATRFAYAPLSWKKRHWLAPTIMASYLRLVSNPRVKHTPRFVGKCAGANTIDINSVLDKLRAADHNVIKIDIEGAEYDIIDAVIAHSENIDLILLELHALGDQQQVFDCVNKLQAAFAICHLHANNFSKPDVDGFPQFLEVTLVRRALLSEENELWELPCYSNPLDAPNLIELPDTEIQFI